jgi:hypothetical protein
MDGPPSTAAAPATEGEPPTAAPACAVVPPLQTEAARAASPDASSTDAGGASTDRGAKRSSRFGRTKKDKKDSTTAGSLGSPPAEQAQADAAAEAEEVVGQAQKPPEMDGTIGSAPSTSVEGGTSLQQQEEAPSEAGGASARGSKRSMFKRKDTSCAIGTEPKPSRSRSFGRVLAKSRGAAALASAAPGTPTSSGASGSSTSSMPSPTPSTVLSMANSVGPRTPFDAFLFRILRTRDAFEAAYREHAFRRSLLGAAAIGVAVLLAALQMAGGASRAADNQVVLATVTEGFQSALSTLTDIVSAQTGVDPNVDSASSGGGGGLLSWLFGDGVPPPAPPSPPSMPLESAGFAWRLPVDVVWARRMLALLNVLLVSSIIMRINEEPSMVARYYTAYTQYWKLAEKALLVAGRDENEEEDDDRTFADPEGGPRCNVVTEEEFAALRELKATIDRDLHRQQLLPLPTSSKSHTRPAGMDERSLFEQCATRDSSCIPACRWPSWMSGAHTPAGATAGDARDHAAAML